MNVFLATPISSIKNISEYKNYQKKVRQLVTALREKGCTVACEIDKIVSINNYDDPNDSFVKDCTAITDCDVFILHYPRATPTSALIELGYAIAKNKKVIIIVPDKNILPYLLQSIDTLSSDYTLLEDKTLGINVTRKILNALEAAVID